MFLKKIIPSLLFASSAMSAMEMPPRAISKGPSKVITHHDMVLIKKFLTPAQNNDLNFYKSKSQDILESVYSIADSFLEHDDELGLIARELKMNKEKLRAMLKNIIENSDRVLRSNKIIPKNKRTNEEFAFIAEFLELGKNTDLNFYKAQSRGDLQRVLSIAVKILDDSDQRGSLSKNLEMSSRALAERLLHIISYSKQALGLVPPVLSSAPVGKVFQEEKTHLQIEFSNQTSDKVVTVWIASGPSSTWELITLLPYQDSKTLEPVQDSSIHLYTESQGYLLLQKDKSLVLAKKALTDKYNGNLVSPYLSTQEIKKMNLKDHSKIVVIIKPDSSIDFAERS